MKLSEAGEARLRGYLYVLERSLRTFLPSDVVADAAREVESHIRERLSQSESIQDERTALERILRELGPPLQVAQA
ncbi:MAG: HAAS signaling domain-containing protein, partial [Acidimicrobiia bacterium]